MDKRLRFINIINFLIGLSIIIEIYTNMLSFDIIPILIIEGVGFVISIWVIKKGMTKFDKIVAFINLFLNILPVCYFILLYFALG